MRVIPVVVILAGLAVAALFTWQYLSASSELKATDQQPSVNLSAPASDSLVSVSPPRINPARKDVNAKVSFGKTFASPSSIVLGKDDRVFLSVFALDSDILLFEPLLQQTYTVKKGQEYLVVFIAYQNTTIRCTQGCDSGTQLVVVTQ